MDDPIYMYGVRTVPQTINLDLPYEVINVQPEDSIVNTRAKHECPYCAAPWYIAGFYNHSEEGLQGKSAISIYHCYKCGKASTGRPRE